MSHVSIKSLGARYREKHGAQRKKSGVTMRKQELKTVNGIDRT
jgi:hypothetical protein